MHYAVTAIGLYEPALFIEKISQFQGGLNPSKRAKLSFVLDELSWLAAHQKQFMRKLTVTPDFINEYAIFRNQLSNLDIRLKDFDGDSALIFADRTKTPRMEPSWE